MVPNLPVRMYLGNMSICICIDDLPAMNDPCFELGVVLLGCEIWTSLVLV